MLYKSINEVHMHLHSNINVPQTLFVDLYNIPHNFIFDYSPRTNVSIKSTFCIKIEFRTKYMLMHWSNESIFVIWLFKSKIWQFSKQKKISRIIEHERRDTRWWTYIRRVNFFIFKYIQNAWIVCVIVVELRYSFMPIRQDLGLR